ncbi:MAG: hypothetical protein M3069_22080 [Chloroflexota bacterium]|nr:hypothetical protein [Chloroflexota bacterium]
MSDRRWEGTLPARLNGEYTRDEQEQATCLRELLGTCESEGVDTAFVYTFANYAATSGTGPTRWS